MKVTLMLLATLVTMRLGAQNVLPFQNPDLPLDQRVNSILSLMTLEEKLACLNTNTSVPRLGIPNAGNSEGLHGLVRRAQDLGGRIPTTSFGQVLGAACFIMERHRVNVQLFVGHYTSSSAIS